MYFRFYPFHYAPYVSDIKDFQDHPLSFVMGKAFLPFEQLLAVLPAASKVLLPEPFQNLMIMEQSPIIDYYPPEFKTDLNGKRQDWEAVVLIPFIDEVCDNWFLVQQIYETGYCRIDRGSEVPTV